MSIRTQLLARLSKGFEADPPSLRLVFWDGELFDFAPAPTVTLTFHSRDVLKPLLKGDFARLGDAYVNGAISVEGDITEVLQIGVALAERFGRFGLARHILALSSRVPWRHSMRRDAANVSYHYDVGNDFYRLWLDERMAYSCAYFKTGKEDIHTAQRQKLDHICRKLMLRPGQRLLDVGCGWGSLLLWAAKRYGVHGLGVTISQRQYAYAKELVSASGLGDRIEIRLDDYRALPREDPFDKIVSVGMYEHVGIEKLAAYFQILTGLLAPGGTLLNHGIVSTDPEGRPRGPAGGEFIDRYVFPGGAVPHLSRVLLELSRNGLEFADAEDLRPHYALTLKHWSRRLEALRDEAIQIAGDRTVRIWRVFLAGMAHAFDHGWLSVAQVLAFKPLANGEVRRPWTRAYQYPESERGLNSELSRIPEMNR